MAAIPFYDDLSEPGFWSNKTLKKKTSDRVTNSKELWYAATISCYHLHYIYFLNFSEVY